jgi:uncharacterized repeat protein (TIGR03803 family)
VTLSWTASAGELTSYLVAARTSAGTSDAATLDTRSISTSFTAIGVEPGTYYVRIQARNACGTSPASNEVVVTVGAPIPTPLTILHVFTGGSDGQQVWSLVQAADGNFYGTTGGGGAFGYGTIFKMTPTGGFSVLYSFNRARASGSSFVEAKDGNFYGMSVTANDWPAANFISAYKVTAAGVFTPLHLFDPATEGTPNLWFSGSDGYLYGTSTWNSATGFNGTAFKLTLDGTVTILHALDGLAPYMLIQTSDGSFYGLAAGTDNTIFFRMTAAGVVNSVYTSAERSYPGTLVQAVDGNLYGTTHGLIPYTAFRLTLGGAFTTLHLFTQSEAFPEWGDSLIQAADGNFYGIAAHGGPGISHPMNGRCFFGCGTIYKMTPTGAVTRLYQFGNDVAGTALIQATDGNLYGTSSGTIFRLTP